MPEIRKFVRYFRTEKKPLWATPNRNSVHLWRIDLIGFDERTNRIENRTTLVRDEETWKMDATRSEKAKRSYSPHYRV